MIKRISFIVFFVLSGVVFSQNNIEDKRILELREELNQLAVSVPGLLKPVDFNISETQLPTFIRSVGKNSEVNISVDTQIKDINLTHSFSNAKVIDVLLYLCKEYNLTIDLTGNIISFSKIPQKKEEVKKYTPRNIPVTYDKNKDLFTIDLQNDTLAIAFKKITDITGKNMVFSPGLGHQKISGYIKEKSFESAVDKLAFSNNLRVTKTKDNYYLFEGVEENITISNGRRGQTTQKKQKPARYRNTNFYFKVLDSIDKKLEVDFENVAIESIIKDIGYELNINSFTNVPLVNIGTASVKANEITFDNLLEKVLEDTEYTFKVENEIYFFGKREQASLRNSEIIPLMHRSIEVMNQPMQSRSRSNFEGNSGFSQNNLYNNNNNSSFNGNQNFNNQQSRVGNNSYQQQRISTTRSQPFSQHQSKSEALVNILPEELKKDLEISTDIEHNAFVVTGDQQKIEKFKEFIKRIDKPVPVILIEVMILEVSKTNTLSAGVEFGLAENTVKDGGQLFSSTDITLGAATINKIIGGFNGFGTLNVGKVTPNFYARIHAMESNGNVKIKSTPKLSTLNGHNATLSNGVTSYYAVTRRDVIGSQNPQTTEIKNYYPIEANLSISIRPLVAGDEQITLSVNVLQSNFNGERIDPEAPPGMNSREFTSTIRVKDQEVVILGGLEENVKNDSGSGIPFLARIPIIKWLFSKRTRTASKSRLSVLIRPTVIK
ncbi:General secretion pathway protein GspD [Tenacibaculum sediminilitoris]|uniref:type II secretion system protein GspD n=1 Tax=Tenacibaculum sediminilitoris TaxID=1820334 RepID=UPI0038940F41